MSHLTIAQSIFWLLTSTIPWLGFRLRCLYTQALINMRNKWCAYGLFMKGDATKVKMSHALATSNSNNFVVYGQKHKVWVLVFLVRMSGTFWDQNWADLVKFSVLQKKPHRLQQLHSRNAVFHQKGWVIKQLFHTSVPWTTWCIIAIGLQPLAIVHQVVHGTLG